jgi:hypothetical protein
VATLLQQVVEEALKGSTCECNEEVITAVCLDFGIVENIELWISITRRFFGRKYF